MVALTCAVALGLAALYGRRDWRVLAGGAIGVVALYQGIALWGTLRNGFVLAVLPGWAERTAAVASLAAGAGLLVAVLAGGVLHEAPERSATTIAPPAGG